MKTAFITGVATGIGAATVRKYIQNNYQVAFIDTNVSEASKLCTELDSDHLLFIEADVRNASHKIWQ